MLPNCEYALELATESIEYEPSFFKDWFGLALARSNNVQEAIKNFQDFIEYIQGQSDQSSQNKNFIVSRQDWIIKLQEGKDPFTEEVLNWLRGREREPYPLTE